MPPSVATATVLLLAALACVSGEAVSAAAQVQWSVPCPATAWDDLRGMVAAGRAVSVSTPGSSTMSRWKKAVYVQAAAGSDGEAPDAAAPLHAHAAPVVLVEKPCGSNRDSLQVYSTPAAEVLPQLWDEDKGLPKAEYPQAGPLSVPVFHAAEDRSLSLHGLAITNCNGTEVAVVRAVKPIGGADAVELEALLAAHVVKPFVVAQGATFMHRLVAPTHDGTGGTHVVGAVWHRVSPFKTTTTGNLQMDEFATFVFDSEGTPHHLYQSRTQADTGTMVLEQVRFHMGALPQEALHVAFAAAVSLSVNTVFTKYRVDWCTVSVWAFGTLGGIVAVSVVGGTLFWLIVSRMDANMKRAIAAKKDA